MRNNPPTDTNEDYNVQRCKRCGTQLDKSKIKPLKTGQISYTAPVGTTDPAAPYDFTIPAGQCWFCGCVQPFDK